jgi:hypothetical protein
MNRWQDWTKVVLGLWFAATPWILGYAGLTGALWSGLITGLVVAVLAALALPQGRQMWAEWLSLVAAVWMFISPWVVGFASNTVALWDALIVAVLVAIAALWLIVSPGTPGMRTGPQEHQHA